jgi:hypothetical protein
VGLNLALLIFFKCKRLLIPESLYQGLFGTSPTMSAIYNFALPVGISFYVFHGISLIIDSYRDRTVINASAEPPNAITHLRPDPPQPARRRPLAHNHRSLSWDDRLLTLDRSADFMGEPAFVTAFRTIRGSHQYDQYDGPDGIAWRLSTLIWAGRLAVRLGGDFVECGTFKSDMAWVVLNAIGAKRIPRLWLFDSVEGFRRTIQASRIFPRPLASLTLPTGFMVRPAFMNPSGSASPLSPTSPWFPPRGA